MSILYAKELEVEEIEIQNTVRTLEDGSKGPSSSWRNDFNAFCQRVKADACSKHLFPIKLLFFFKFATLYVLYPFLTLHMKSLGLTPDETGINSAFIPIVSILGSPLSGVIADKIGNFKVLMALVTLSNAGMALLLLLVPTARETLPLPLNMTFALNCSESGHFLLSSVDSLPCQLNRTQFTLPETPLNCGFICKSEPSLPMSSSSFSQRLRPDLSCDGGSSSCFLSFSEESSPELQPLEPNLGVNRVNYSSRNGQNLVFIEGKSDNLTSIDLLVDGDFLFGDRKYIKPPKCLNSIQNSKNCTPICFATYSRGDICSNSEYNKVNNVGLTFGLYTLFRIILGLGSATSFIMFEGAVLAILKEYGGCYGIQRVTGALAGILVTPISGLLIHQVGDFRPAFFLYATLQTFTAFLTLKIDLNFKTPAKNVWGSLKGVLSSIEIILFFFAMLISGSAWGYLESFLFWFLKDLGGSELLMGLTVSVGSLFGIPFLIMSGPIIKVLGHANVLCMGLLVFSFRLFGYSYISDPWFCLIFEAMECITASLSLTAAATYAAALSTEQTITSIQGITGGLYFGFGRGLGSLVGGFLIQAYGHQNTFRIFALASLISSFLYYLVNMAYIRKHTKVDYSNTNLHVKESYPKKEDKDLRKRISNKSILFGDKEDRNGNLNQTNMTKDKQTETEQAQSSTGGYIGPLTFCELDEYTDIPLDEVPPPLEELKEQKRNSKSFK